MNEWTDRWLNPHLAISAWFLQLWITPDREHMCCPHRLLNPGISFLHKVCVYSFFQYPFFRFLLLSLLLKFGVSLVWLITFLFVPGYYGWMHILKYINWVFLSLSDFSILHIVSQAAFSPALASYFALHPQRECHTFSVPWGRRRLSWCLQPASAGVFH